MLAFPRLTTRLPPFPKILALEWETYRKWEAPLSELGIIGFCQTCVTCWCEKMNNWVTDYLLNTDVQIWFDSRVKISCCALCYMLCQIVNDSMTCFLSNCLILVHLCYYRRNRDGHPSPYLMLFTRLNLQLYLSMKTFTDHGSLHMKVDC